MTRVLTYGKNSGMKVVKVTSKGRVTIPSEIRDALGLDKETYLEVSEDDGEIRLRKVLPAQPLSGDDPIWGLVGAGDSGRKDIARDHDRHLAEGEMERWRESS